MKQEIIDYLLSKGFSQNGDVFTFVMKRPIGEYIINGQRNIRYQDTEIHIKYIYEGWEGNSEEDSIPITQWSIAVQGETATEFIIHGLEEFKEMIK